jgi:hypothetical protein
MSWADFKVGAYRAIRRHWTRVCCAFAFCWWHQAYEVHVHGEVTPQAAEKTHKAALERDVAGYDCCGPSELG